MQEKFREAHLIRISKETRLKDFDKVLSKKIKEIEHLKELNSVGQLNAIEMNGIELFGGKFSSIEHALSEFELERFYYATAFKNEKHLYEGLKREGLTDAQIEDIIMHGKYAKYAPDKNKKNKEKCPDYVQ